MGYHELAPQLHRVKQARQLWEQWANHVAPRFLALSVFAAGNRLAFGPGATPLSPAHRWLRDLLPLPVIEYRTCRQRRGCIVVAARPQLQRRIETAYYVVVALLGLGVLVSVLKGFDYEESLATERHVAIVFCRREPTTFVTAVYSPNRCPLVGWSLLVSC